MHEGYFITGTDTGVGKTLIAAALLEVAKMQGQQVVGMKPVAAGCEHGSDRLYCHDSESLRRASNVQVSPALITPYAYAAPVAPHLAAEIEQRPIELGPIVAAFERLKNQSDFIIAEGVGGFVVPLGLDFDSTDLAHAFGLPVILIVGMRLGCLNHALLTQQAITAHGLEFAGWVANCIDPAMMLRDENIAALEQRLNAPLLGVVPFIDNIRSCTAAAFLDLPASAG